MQVPPQTGKLNTGERNRLPVTIVRWRTAHHDAGQAQNPTNVTNRKVIRPSELLLVVHVKLNRVFDTVATVDISSTKGDNLWPALGCVRFRRIPPAEIDLLEVQAR